MEPQTSIEQLPSTALVSILQHLPQEQRLGASAFVGAAWAAAAAEACTSVSLPWHHVEARMAKRIEVFQAWLAKHGRHVQMAELQLAGWRDSLHALRLPCSQLAQLRRLDASGGALSLAADSSPPGLAVLPALRSLSLQHCKVSAALLSSAPLTFLQLSGVSLDATTNGRTQGFGAGVASLLAHQLQLVELVLTTAGVFITPAATAQLAALRKLHLPRVTGERMDPRVQGAALANLRSLEDLKMIGVVLVEQPGNIYAHTTTPAATAELMGALQHLTALQLLELDDVGLKATTQEQLAQFSGLTASSKLRTLHVEALRAQPLPRGALRRAFPAGRQLPQLQKLVVAQWEDEPLREPRSVAAYQQFWCVSAADLAAVAAACSGLQLLSLCHVLAPQPELVGALAQLQQQLHLPELTVSDWNGWLTDESAPALAQMGTSLRALCIGGAPLLTDVGLACITQLTALTQLTVSLEDSALSKEMRQPCGGEGKCRIYGCPWCDQGEWAMALKCEGDDGPRVWQQLAARLKPSPLLAQAADQQPHAACAGCVQLRQALTAQLEDHEEQLDDLRAELAALRAERAGGR